MISTPQLVRANQETSQVVTCSTTDRLVERFPISVVFFYREELSEKLLIEALREVLVDFPLFSGRLKIVDSDLLIDCNNQGVQFSLGLEDCTLIQTIRNIAHAKLQALVDSFVAEDALAGHSPLLTIRLTKFSYGGTALGICWHHSIGDMHTFMQFMNAWSAITNEKRYTPPLIVEDRDAYLLQRVAKNKNVGAKVRYLKAAELLRLTLYMVTTGRRKTSTKIYFSDSEIENMKKVFLEKTGQTLSKNDVLCAHVFNVITNLDNYNKDRRLVIILNYRNRIGLPQNLLGNLVDTINLPFPLGASPFEVASAIREGVNSFESKHLSAMSNYQYIQDRGGMKKGGRFLGRSIDPIKRTITMTNWSKFGVYEVNFLDAKPLFFASVDEFPTPWICTLVEGFSNQGIIFSAHLPAKLIRKLERPNSLKQLHQYRDADEHRSALVESLAWLH